jgi:thymidylate synthase
VINSRRFEDVHDAIADNLYHDGETVVAKRWQGQDISDKKEMAPIELRNVVFEIHMPRSLIGAKALVQPNLPWADEHFEERVAGFPVNPPPSADTWPFKQSDHQDYLDLRGQFSHTYPERFWPKHAGHQPVDCNAANRCEGDEPLFCIQGTTRGTRFEYGDLEDVVRMLREDRHTRQAYLPVWFPEDTGAIDGQRVPCSLGYHFMIRRNKLHVTYLIRAVDFMRHFRDDVYMAVRLAQWVQDMVNMWVNLDDQVVIGNLTMHTMSMHCFEGDLPALGRMIEDTPKERSGRLLGAMR